VGPSLVPVARVLADIAGGTINACRACAAVLAQRSIAAVIVALTGGVTREGMAVTDARY
jgi:hypothetical protein